MSRTANKNNSRHRHLKILVLLNFLLAFPCLSDTSESRMDQLMSMPLEELINLKISSAGKRAEKVSDIPANVTIVTRKEIAEYGYTTLAEIIEDIPGMYNTNNYNGNSSNFGVRGNLNPRYQNTNFAILVNGISQLRDDNRSNPFEEIRVPVESIDRIEFIRGPMSVMYGNGAFFGTINIVTNEITDHSTIFSAGFGSMDTSKFSARWMSTKNEVKLMINASTIKSDGVDRQFRNMMTSDNLASLPSVGVSDPDYSTKNLLEDEAKYINFIAEYKGLYFDTTHVESNAELFFLYPSVDGGTVNKLKTTNVTLGFKTSGSSNFNYDGKLSYNNHDQDLDVDLLYPGFYGFQDIDFESYHTEHVFHINPSDKLHMVFGIDYREMRNFRDHVDAPDIGVNNELVLISSRTTQSIYTQETYSVTNKLNLVAGYRYEKIKKFDFNGFINAGSPAETTFGGPREEKISETPRIAAIYSLSPQQSIKLMYGEASRVSEDAFDPETIETTEVNYNLKLTNIISSVSIYRNKLDNLLVKRLEIRPGGIIAEKDSPSGKIETKGIEFILDWVYQDNMSGELSIALQESDEITNDNINPGFSPETIIHGKFSYTSNKQVFSVSARYIDSIESLYNPAIDNGDGTYGARVGEGVSDYFIVDANYRHKAIFDNVYFNFRITNLFDEEVHYANEAFYTAILNKGTIGPGRTFFASIGYKI